MRKLGLAVVVFAALLVVSGIPQLAESALSVVRYQTQPGTPTSGLAIAGALLPIVLAAGLALGLIAYRHQLAAWLFPEDELDIVLTGDGLLRVGLLVIAVSMIAWSIPGLVGSVISGISEVIQMRSDLFGGGEGELGTLFLFSSMSVAIPISQFVVGLVLLLNARKWASSLWVVRPAKVPQALGELPACPACGQQYDPADYMPGAVRKCTRCHSELPDT